MLKLLFLPAIDPQENLTPAEASGGVPLGNDPSIVWAGSVPVPDPGRPSCDDGSSSSVAVSSGQSGGGGRGEETLCQLRLLFLVLLIMFKIRLVLMKVLLVKVF